MWSLLKFSRKFCPGGGANFRAVGKFPVTPGWLASPGQPVYEYISISVYRIARSTFHTSPTRGTLLETRVDPGWRGTCEAVKSLLISSCKAG